MGRFDLPAKKTLIHELLGPDALRATGGLVLAAAGLLLTASGAYESIAGMHWAAAVFAFLLAAAVAYAIFEMVCGRIFGSLVALFAASSLWTVFACLLFRVAAPYAAQAIILPVLLFGAYLVVLPLRIAICQVLAGFVIESGLWLTGSQSLRAFLLNGGVYLFASAGFLLFEDCRSYVMHRCAMSAADRDEAKAQQYAEAFGLDESSRADANILPAEDEIAADTLSIVKTVVSSFELQLEIICQALSLRSAVLFWPDLAGENFTLIAKAGLCDGLKEGPFASAAGIFGILHRKGDELAMAGLSGFGGLVYYRDYQNVGSIFAVKVSEGAPGPEDRRYGVLCVDRLEKDEWLDSEIEVMRLAACKMGMSIAMGRRLQKMDRERTVVAKVMSGLRELNGVLDLASAFDAAVTTVKGVAAAEFVAISLMEDECHRIARAEGIGAEGMADQVFCKDDGLVGQALAKNIIVPTNGVNRSAAPIFSNSRRVEEFKSLLIIPLRKKGDGEALGALVVAARDEGVFNRQGRHILELIAGQIAIKIDLARAYEKINRLASTDGLTGLINHRTFHHGFDIMLQRAERQKKQLCMLLCDVDHFKGVNDTFGHPFGDLVLKEVAKALADSLRQVDLVARYGGEEFFIVLEDCNEKAGYQLAERIRQTVGSLPLLCENVAVKITLSIGLASYPSDGIEKVDLISKADQALYQAKESGRNQTVCWSQSRSA